MKQKEKDYRAIAENFKEFLDNDDQWEPVSPDKVEKQFMIYDSNYGVGKGKYFGESFGTIDDAESRIEEFEEEYGPTGLYVIDRQTGKEV